MRTILKIAVAACMALAAAPVVAADAPLQVSYPSDAGMDCAAIGVEVGRMDALIAESNGKISGADGASRGAGLAGTVAVEGMLRTGILGRAPGIGMFANQAANAAKQRAEQQKVALAEQIRVADTRKALLAGLYSGKGCDAPQAIPAAAPATEAAPAAAEPAAS